MIDPDRGLWLFRASRLEALVDPLEALLQHLRPEGLLAPQTVLVGHPGLRPWLRQQLGQKRGPQGIVANLELALPSPWLEALARQCLGTDPLPGWQRERLRWRLFSLLPTLADARVQALLEGDDGRQAFALAERLAEVLAPLMLYRQDWLAAWERGRPAVADDALLAEAWRGLAAQSAAFGPHRGERLRRLAQHLAEARECPPGLARDPLHVFGLAHLPPPELAVLRALSRWRPVVFHVADPCRVHWLGLGTDRRALRQAMQAEDLGESHFLALDHPLLAAWGRLGQHFLLALEDGELALDERHGADAEEASPPRHLLDRVQRSLRGNAPEAMRMDAEGLAALAHDASLRVLRCASPLRELEMLRAALAHAFRELPDLQPSEVGVLSPNPERYRALLPAVFGEPGRGDGPWPWHAADVPLAALHPVYRALLTALALPGTRLSAQGVLDLLALPPVARRFGLDGEDEGSLRHALARLRVAWGLDAEDRARNGAPATPAHTFAWGLDRAVAGLVFGERDPEPLTLPDGQRVLPGEGIDGGIAERLERLQALLEELRAWSALGTLRLPPEDWEARLLERIDGLFQAPPGDEASREAITGARAQVAALAEEWREARQEAPLPWAAVRAALAAKLEAVPERQRFLAGGITFCGMVPQRAIPFRVIAVLGLDEGQLPRPTADDGLDLRARHPRPGDRDLASDDRYLFLETLMAARDRLHLSFLGLGADDGRPRNPAAPLAELLEALARFVPPAGTVCPAAGWPWTWQAPLQPPAPLPRSVPEITPAEAAVCSVAVREQAAPGSTPPAIKEDRPLPSLGALIEFFRDPAKQVLRSELGLRLAALEDDRLDEDEPLAPDADHREGFARDLFFAALEAGTETVPDALRETLQLGGRLPPGALGERRFAIEWNQATFLLGALRASEPAPEGPLSPPQPLALRVPLSGGRVLEGRLLLRHEASGRPWLIEVHGRERKSLGFRALLPLAIAGAALRLAGHPPPGLALLGKDGVHEAGAVLASLPPDPARDAAFLEALIDFREGVLRGERRYAPDTSWTAAWIGDHGPEGVAEAWAGSPPHQRGERDRAPGYAALWGRAWRFVPGDGEVERFATDAQRLQALWQALIGYERLPPHPRPPKAGRTGDAA